MSAVLYMYWHYNFHNLVSMCVCIYILPAGPKPPIVATTTSAGVVLAIIVAVVVVLIILAVGGYLPYRSASNHHNRHCIYSATFTNTLYM